LTENRIEVSVRSLAAPQIEHRCGRELHVLVVGLLPGGRSPASIATVHESRDETKNGERNKRAPGQLGEGSFPKHQPRRESFTVFVIAMPSPRVPQALKVRSTEGSRAGRRVEFGGHDARNALAVAVKLVVVVASEGGSLG
jgi:hypothetical protein